MNSSLGLINLHERIYNQDGSQGCDFQFRLKLSNVTVVWCAHIHEQIANVCHGIEFAMSLITKPDCSSEF